MSGLPIELQAAFTDIGTLDTHTATIDWGDGAAGQGVVTGSGGTGSVRGTHTWSATGSVTVTVSVSDDDTGVGTRTTNVIVVDAEGAVCALASQLTPVLRAAGLSPEAAKALTQLLSVLDGNKDGLAANGACDMFAKDNWVAALVKLEQAVQTIEASIAGGSLTPAQTAVLRPVETRLLLAAKWTHVTLLPAATSAPKQADAIAQAQRAAAATSSRDYVSAIGHWLAAVRLLAPLE